MTFFSANSGATVTLGNIDLGAGQTLTFDGRGNFKVGDGTAGFGVISGTNDHGYIWCNNVQNAGWSFTVPADTTMRTLNVLYGGATNPSNAIVKITAHLSDNSATDFTNTSTIANAMSDSSRAAILRGLMPHLPARPVPPWRPESAGPRTRG